MRPGPMSPTAVVRAVTWLAALVVATGAGVVAISQVGDGVRDSGPLGTEVMRVEAPTPAPTLRPRPGIAEVRQDLTGDFGAFTVLCQGPVASGIGASPNPGWSVIRFEPGPDDDVEVVFANAEEFVELEAFCNRGIPEVAELDRSRVTGSLEER